MKSDWPTVRLGDHVDACLGKMLDAAKNKGKLEQYLGNSNVRWGEFDLAGLAEMRFEIGEAERYSLHPGDLVVCEGGEPGRCAIWNGPKGMKFQKALHRIRPDASLDHHFLFYWFRHAGRTGQLDAHFTGTTIKHLTGKAVTELRVRRPPLAEQRAMIDVLKPLDSRIALLRETNATLEAIAQALFKSWFIDFDHVRTSQQGLRPTLDGAAAALSPAAALKIEANVSRQAVSNLVASGILLIGDGYRAKNEELGKPGLPFVRAGDLESGQITPTKDHLSAQAVIGAFSKMAKPGDTAFTSKGTIGRFAFVDDASGDAVYSPQVCFWRSLRPDIVEPTYLHYWMKSEAFKVQVNVVRGQAAIMDYVSLSDQRRMYIDVPAFEIQRRFADIARPLLTRISSGRATASSLAALRDTLLPRLISGQLRVPEVEALAE